MEIHVLKTVVDYFVIEMHAFKTGDDHFVVEMHVRETEVPISSWK